MFLDCSRNIHPVLKYAPSGLTPLKPPNTMPGSTSCWKTSHPATRPLWHRDLRSLLIPPPEAHSLSLVTGTHLPPRKPAIDLVVPIYRVGHSFLSCSVCPPSRPVSLSSVFILLSFPITSFVRLFIRSFICSFIRSLFFGPYLLRLYPIHRFPFLISLLLR